MIKGKTIIELKDVHTGEVERYEDHNMVTNALNQIFRPFGHYKAGGQLFSSLVPYYQNLLGGLLLFSEEIEENADNYFPPASAELTGCAVYGVQNATTGTTRGDYNTTESEVNLNDRYVKFVYDFTTSQANGTIASVALTSKMAGYCGYGSKDATLVDTSNRVNILTSNGSLSLPGATNTSGTTLGETQFLFAVDVTHDIVYQFRLNSIKSISIIKRKGFMNSLSLFQNPSNGGDIIDITDIALSVGLKSTYFSYNYCVDDGYLYISSSTNYTVTAGESFSVIRIRLSDLSVNEYTLTNQTNVTLDIGYGGRYQSYVYKGYLYARNYSSPRDFYKIKVSNSTDVTKIKNSSDSVISSSYPRPIFSVNGRIYMDTFSHSGSTSGTERNGIINTETDELLVTECRYLCGTSLSGAIPVIDCKGCYYNYGNFYMLGNYLATINNLDSPVTKTADKTMKVTYIIQEHDS